MLQLKVELGFLKNNNLYISELNAVKELIPPNKNGIEVGIGTGKFAVPLGIKVGIEPSHKMAEIARSQKLKVLKAVAEELPFDKEKFDFVLMVTTICFYDDVQGAFKEAYRVLKPNGAIIIAFIDKYSELGKINEKNKAKSKFYKQATFYSVDEVSEYLAKAGFKNFNYRQTIFNLENIVHNVEEGYGKGSFVVIRAEKQAA